MCGYAETELEVDQRQAANLARHRRSKRGPVLTQLKQDIFSRIV